MVSKPKAVVGEVLDVLVIVAVQPLLIPLL